MCQLAPQCTAVATAHSLWACICDFEPAPFQVAFNFAAIAIATGIPHYCHTHRARAHEQTWVAAGRALQLQTCAKWWKMISQQTFPCCKRKIISHTSSYIPSPWKPTCTYTHTLILAPIILLLQRHIKHMNFIGISFLIMLWMYAAIAFVVACVSILLLFSCASFVLMMRSSNVYLLMRALAWLVLLLFFGRLRGYASPKAPNICSWI